MNRINFGQKLLDNRWKASDQLIQLKGLVEFDERYRYWLGLKDEIIVEEREEKLKKYAKRVKQLRNLFQQHNVADIEAIEEVLQQDREIFLICRGKKPMEIIENLKQMVFRKKLAVDKTFYEVKKKEKELYEIQSKISECKEKISQEEEIKRNKEIEEREKYSAALEYAKTQKDVCRITLDNYDKLLGILKNDSHYFDDLLNTLKEDALVQSNAILRMLTLGQMLADDFSWLKNESKKLALTFNSGTRDLRMDIREINNDIKQLETLNSKLRDYAAFSYPLFQEDKKHTEESKEDSDTRALMQDLSDFQNEWKVCLNAEEEKDFFPNLFKVSRMSETLHTRMGNVRMQKDFHQEFYEKLSLVTAELDTTLDEDVVRQLEEILSMEKEIDSIAEEMRSIKSQEDEINEEMDLYKNNIYQFWRLLQHVCIGPSFGGEKHLGSDIDIGREALNNLRFENPEFHLDTESEHEESEKQNMEGIARFYLDPRATFDEKETNKYEDTAVKKEDPILLLDNIMMKMKTVQEYLPPTKNKETTEEELMSLGNFYADFQEEVDQIVDKCMQNEKIVYKSFKPKQDDFHKKSCSNNSRMEIKIENQKIVFDNEGPAKGVVIMKGAIHPPGVIRGMYVPETDSEEEDEDEEKKDEGADQAKSSDEDEIDLGAEEDGISSSSEGEALDSDLDPDKPKPHICF